MWTSLGVVCGTQSTLFPAAQCGEGLQQILARDSPLVGRPLNFRPKFEYAGPHCMKKRAVRAQKKRDGIGALFRALL